MKRGFFVLFTGLLILCIAGCYYDKAELVYPVVPNCDTTAVTYSNHIVNILKANCYTCHGGDASMGSGIKLDTYTGLKRMVDNSIFFSAVTHTGSASPMPKNGAKLSECNIAIIRTWLRSNAPNN